MRTISDSLFHSPNTLFLQTYYLSLLNVLTLFSISECDRLYWSCLRRSRRGVNLSVEMLRHGKKAGRSPEHRLAADVESLPFADNLFDFALANTVLHWLNVPESVHTIEPAIREMKRVLKKKALLALSIAGVGTAVRFQESYRRVVEPLTTGLPSSAPPFRYDPIGCMERKDVVCALEKAGFEVIWAQMFYEPVSYEDGGAYATDVEAYGYGIYLASFPEECRPAIWKRIVDDFVKSISPGRYEHDQYMIYAIARRS